MIGKYNFEMSGIEHRLYNTFFGKLILSMFSSTEKVFVQNKPCITTDYFEIINNINTEMKNMLKSNIYIKKSWFIFYDKLIDGKTYYKYTNYNDLSDRLKDCYDNKFPIEILLADCIKQLIPSVSLNYLNIVKYIYILGRLIVIYINTYTTIDMKDLIIICRAVSSLYESYYYSISMIPRGMPKFIENCSEEFKLYYISHAITGPEYYLFKQLEYSIPCYLTKNTEHNIEE